MTYSGQKDIHLRKRPLHGLSRHTDQDGTSCSPQLRKVRTYGKLDPGTAPRSPRSLEQHEIPFKVCLDSSSIRPVLFTKVISGLRPGCDGFGIPSIHQTGRKDDDGRDSV